MKTNLMKNTQTKKNATNDVVVFVPYGSRLGFHVNDVAATMANIDYKFPQCVCYKEECKLDESYEDDE